MRETSTDCAKKRAAALRDRQRNRAVASPLTAMDAASVAWRRDQAHADADIEGLARDPETGALVAEMDAAGLSAEERRARLAAYYRAKAQANLAAE